jgi:hypothetical protein
VVNRRVKTFVGVSARSSERSFELSNPPDYRLAPYFNEQLSVEGR